MQTHALETFNIYSESVVLKFGFNEQFKNFQKKNYCYVSLNKYWFGWSKVKLFYTF